MQRDSWEWALIKKSNQKAHKVQEWIKHETTD
jgi:hypothetical protein